MPSRKTRQRKPSHFGSYCQLSPTGMSSTDRASIGGNGVLSEAPSNEGDGLHTIEVFAASADSIHVRSIADGADHVIAAGFMNAPNFSPDEKRISGATWVGEEPQMTIMNADGSGARTVAKMGQPSDILVDQFWSPDGRYVAYRWDGRHSLFVSEAATGKTMKVGSADFWLGDVRWRPDSRTMRYVRSNGTQANQKISVRETTIDGQDREVRDVTAKLPGASGLWFAGDTAVVAAHYGLLVPLSDAPPRKLYEAGRVRKAPSLPSFRATAAGSPHWQTTGNRSTCWPRMVRHIVR